MKKTIRVLFVCMGNICRSPAAEGILKHLATQLSDFHLYAASCGIGDWHIGQAPDWRIQEASVARGVALTSQAQQFKREFLDQFDYILASDREVLRDLYHYAHTAEQKAKVHLMTEFSANYKGQEVPDPYYKGQGAFELVLDMLEDACQGLIEQIRTRYHII